MKKFSFILTLVLVVASAAATAGEGVEATASLRASAKKKVKRRYHHGYRSLHATVKMSTEESSAVMTSLLKTEYRDLPPPGVSVAPSPAAFYDPRFPTGRNVVLSVIGVVLLGLLFWWFHSEKYMAQLGDAQKRDHKCVEEDTYGFAVVSVIRDLQQIAAGEAEALKLRVSRVGFALSLLAFNVLLQGFITVQVKNYVTSMWVFGIREDYDAYELHMYGTEPGATYLTANGKHRGNPGYFMPGNFETLPDGLKQRVCNIPFSQTPFFMCVLLIWSLTCIGEVRMCIANFRSYVVNTKTIENMKDALVDLDPDIDDADPANRWVVDGLTRGVKVMVVCTVILPRLILTLLLLWLGCRFLAATNDFGEMVLNAVALEFVLMIKDLLYVTIVPDRNKREVEKICIRPSQPVEWASYWTYLGTFSWLFVAMGWIFYYVFLFQLVLPGYNWDVRLMCSPWLEAKYGGS